MDGLEVSEIRLSNLERINRIDAEFYQKGNLLVEKILDKWDKKAFSECFDVSDGNHMSISDDFCDYGVPYYRGQDIYNLFIENSNPLYISNEAYNKSTMWRSYLKRGDVLLSIVGTIGKSAIVTSDRKATCSCKLAILRSRDEAILPETMLMFIKTKYGQGQIQKFRRGAVQTGLLLEDFEQLFIPQFSKKLQYICKEYMDRIKMLMNEAALIYSEAEQLLINILGLKDFNFQPQKYTVKSFRDSFEYTGRLDAEFYQSYYDEFEKKVKANGYVIASEICSLINYGTVPTSPYTENGLGTPYIKGMNLKNVDIQEYNLDRIINTEGLSEKFYTKKGDIIISQMGTVADCGVVEETQENWLFASFTIRLRLKDFKVFNPYFIGLYIQKLAKQYYFHRHIAQASVRQNTDLPTVNNLFIPIVDINIQNQIAYKIKESKRKKRESIMLLKKAINYMEMAIEQGEDVALKLYT
ncbi:MAG: hypothetical protein NC433_07505 [Clostridiales bacterium]|nr:hypothetical protein [Clostridiales bacterium]